MEAYWVAAVYEANATRVREENDANEAQQMANEWEASEAANRVADEFEAREKHWRRENAARAALGIGAEADGYVVSEEQVRMEIAAIEVQERREATLVRARARNQASSSSNAQLAQKMAEEYAYEAEEAKAQHDADEAMARSIARKEAGEERQKRRGADRKSPTEELNDHVKVERERKLRCEARGDEYVPITYMADEEENGTGQLRMTEARVRTEQYVQRMVTRKW